MMTDKNAQTTDIANELLNRADTIGAWLQGKVDPALDFATKQAVDIAQQYVLYGMVSNTFGALFCLLGLGVCIWMVKRFFVKFGGSILVPAIPVGVGALLGAYGYMQSAILVYTAPKVWLMLELATLMKGIK
jgi:hypothetical protein